MSVPTTKLTDEERGYMAGILDTNGSLWVQRNRTVLGLVLRIGNLTIAQADWMKQKYNDCSIRRNQGAAYVVIVTPITIAVIFSESYPSLIRMKSLASLVFRFAKTSKARGIPLSAGEKAERVCIKKELHLLCSGRQR